MMESISLQQLQVVEDQLEQIKESIGLLQEWNKELRSVDDLLMSSSGMKTLAADCMLIEAIGESVKRIDEKTNGQLFALRPEIPWNQVKGMRNHIAHGYFDINTDYVWDVIQNDLLPLQEAIDYLHKNLFELIPFNEE
ncbi:MAG: DUF86 domain-containing protein [Prevotella sp.]|nr:DUF86 domain-containing protein [Prevotella sp.]